MQQRRYVVKPEACTMGCDSISISVLAARFCVYDRVFLNRAVADPVTDNPPDLKKPGLRGQASGRAE